MQSVYIYVGMYFVWTLAVVASLALIYITFNRINWLFCFIGNSRFFLSIHGGIATWRVGRMSSVLRRSHKKGDINKEQYDRLNNMCFKIQKDLRDVYHRYKDMSYEERQ